MYESYSELNSYQEVADYFSRARHPERGKPFRNWGIIHKSSSAKYSENGTPYTVKFRWAYTKEDHICNIYPNNTIEFVYPKDYISYHGTTLVGSFTRGLPLIFVRVKTGKYRLVHTKLADKQHTKIETECNAFNETLPQETKKDNDYLNWVERNSTEWRYSWNEYYKWLRGKSNQEYFEGITFDLATGECVNPRDDLEVEINKDNRKEWLRIVKRFKKGLRVRAKSQVFTSLVDDAVKLRKEYRQKGVYDREKTDLTDPNNIDWIVHCMKENKYPVELLTALVDYMYDHYQGYYYWEFKAYNHKEVIDNINKIFDKLSIPLREKFNVFIGDVRP